MKEVRMMIGGGTDTNSLTAMAAHVRAGDVFLGAGSDESQIGTLIDRSIITELSIPSLNAPLFAPDAIEITEDNQGTKKVMLAPPTGDYPGGKNGAYIGVKPEDIGVTADKVAVGETAAGVKGTYGSDASVEPENMKAGITAYGAKGKISGNQTDYGNVAKTLSAGESYDINQGFYGKGKIVAKDLASQTAGNLEPGKMLAGQYGYSNGQKVSGNQTDYGNVAKTLSAGESYDINQGFYGKGKIVAKDLASQTAGNLEPGKMLAGQYGYSNGQKISGSIVSYKDYAYAKGLGGGNDGTEYWAFNGAPAGYYYNSGNDWAPELRLAKSKVREALNISAENIRKGAVVGEITGTWYGGKDGIHAFAARGFGMSSSQYETYSEESFTMPEDGTVYYGGASCGYHINSSKCRILKNGTVIADRDFDGNTYYNGWRGTMFNKSFSANKGDVIKVVCEQSSGTHGMSCIQAIMVY